MAKNTRSGKGTGGMGKKNPREFKHMLFLKQLNRDKNLIACNSKNKIT